ncbi:zinc ABC transporter substrate-binding protein [Pseudonocardia sp. KRD-184]|uniref:Zinc ABC transporter substrate-binding protein n=1 Tax=Pseudonocardia oceani TaxID=2792013 RepID=A0ABS6UB05_9PSEU|nr:zinc ABC transporter substrate-binding protein [Pseudonocardia oceani]MBW0089520.1 zinc ABC transporter substrate-binding protein [Pseudonocardia oceani]MBW0096530.1 zinc ABC transporter substrate-binding protein [Pseudonocardia oceani]MBW0109226.1 zinc ABC transporter substrate-binding protein [Pseudonocardia oceani]MBW0119858.1 zinc ABC transporter substrate-binding protein [Pseudonocardia oceani]MBW0129421.1 zinc ABC transporter substrate-binding protein [Pseudonocardia oceani]
MKRPFPRSVVGLLVVALLALTGCTSTAASGDEPIGDRPVRVTTTTNFITDTVERIGGDAVEVTGLMGPGVDPHLYRASAGDVRTLREADVIFYGGLQLEGRMAELLGELAARQPTRAVTDGIPRTELLAPAPGANEEYDPHVWFDVSLWEHVSRTIADTLAERDPARAGTYRANLDAYLAELTELDAYVAERMAAIPPERRLLVTSHDAFEYFGRRYGLEVAGIQGISTAAEATTADVERVAELIAARGVPAVFVESSVPRQTIDALIAAAAQRGAVVTVGGELFTDAAGSPGTPEGTYTGMLRANADLIADGLGS